MKYLSIKRLTSIFVFLPTFFALAFGMFCFEINLNSMNMAGRCPFESDHSSICATSPIEHIKEFQNMFSTLPIKEDIQIFSLLIPLFLIFGFYFLHESIASLYARKWSSYRKKPNTPTFLQEAFSDGILNPKTF